MCIILNNSGHQTAGDNCPKIFVFTQDKGAVCQSPHLRIIVPEESFHSGDGMYFQYPVVGFCYFFFDVMVDFFGAEISFLFRVFQ